MEEEAARRFAGRVHGGQRTRGGSLVTDHLARVAAHVPPGLRPTAWLHDVAERSPVAAHELCSLGLTREERDGLDLLTRAPDESYELYVLRIAFAGGEAGRIARVVKLADLDDHIARDSDCAGAPPYAWARRRIAVAHARSLAADPLSGVGDGA